MEIKMDAQEIISLQEFQLGERFIKAGLTESELKALLPFSMDESKRLHKIIDFYNNDSYLKSHYASTDWFTSIPESEHKIEKFRTIVSSNLLHFEEAIIISWNRRLALKCSKRIFLKYWYVFLKPHTDHVTIVSEKMNWVLFFSSYGVSNLWYKN